MQLDERLIIAPIRSTKSGMPGPVGPAGPKGDKGEDGQTPEHRWIDTSLQFKTPSGSWGQAVNLKGPKGDSGGSPSENKIQAETENGDKYDLEVIRYNTADSKISYDPMSKSLTFNPVEHSYQLDWTVNSKLELPSGNNYIGAIVYVKTENDHYYYDGIDWKSIHIDQIDANKLSMLVDGGKWITTSLSVDQKKLILDSKDSFFGIFNTLDDLKASPLVGVSGQSIAIVNHPDNVPSGNPVEMLYVLIGNSWSPVQLSGKLFLSDGSSARPFTNVKAGDNITIDYNESNREITINSSGGGSGPAPDLSKYVKGENVQQKYPGTDWGDVEWDDSSKILKIGVPKPDFTKMSSVLAEGDNISFEQDASTGKLKIGANFNPDLTPYVRGAGITSTNGISTAWDRATQQLTIGYRPKFTDVSALLEAGDNITIEQGTDEKVKISSNVVIPPPADLSPYAKKANIKSVAGYWGEVEVNGDDVDLKIKPTAQQLIDMFSPQSDTSFSIDGDLVKFDIKDGRQRLYNTLTKSSSGNQAMLKAGDQIHFNIDDTNQTIEVVCTAREFSSDSIKVTLPLTASYDSATNSQTLGFSPAGFVNLTDQVGSNVSVGYNSTENKITYNVNPALIPTVRVEKDSSGEGFLSKLQVLNAGDAFQIQDDPANPGKKVGILTMHDKYQVIGHASGVDSKLTEITVRGDIPNQVAYATDGKLVVDLTKSNFVGRFAKVVDLPTDAVDNKSYGYVTSDNGYDVAYIRQGGNWVPHYASSGVLLVTPGTPSKYDIIKQINNNNAVSFKDGELTINQSGVLYRHAGADDPLYQLEVDGDGVSTTFDARTGSLKLTIAGGSGATTTPLKVTAKHQDGSVLESADVREIIFDGDTSGLISEDIPAGGKKITLPVGIMLEVDSTLAKITAKYDPMKYKGKLVFNYTNDTSGRVWYACDGEKWVYLASDELTTATQEIIDRLSTQAHKAADANFAKDKTGWILVDKTAPDIPDYEKPDGSKEKVDGFVFTMTNGIIRQQTFYPATTYQLPAYRNWNSSTNAWTDWVSSSVATDADIKAAIDHHNEQHDAHENVILPVFIATMRTNWFEMHDNQATSSLKGTIPMMLFHDNTGRAKIRPESGTDSNALYIDRKGSYNITWMFQMTGTLTNHGTLNLKVMKNDKDTIVEKSFNIATQGKEFDAFKLSAKNVQLDQGDCISVVASYSGDSTWTEANKKESRIDAMKNYLVVEHNNSVSGTHIANTYREILGGLVTLPGYEAQILPDVSDPSIATFVEVTGGQYSVTVNV